MVSQDGTMQTIVSFPDHNHALQKKESGDSTICPVL